jgi:FkbM family methyltransferase
MSLRTSRWVIRARNLGRSLGVNKILARLILGREYEKQYDLEFSKCIRPGDCIWDIGANIGHYTEMFSKRVGDTGKVIAFEPSPTNYSRLSDRCSAYSNVSLFQLGLGATDSMVNFIQGEDSLGATSRFVDDTNDGVSISIRTVESLLAQKSCPLPNVVKIDVEGFEPDVLNGFGRWLENESIRTIGIEIHFGILMERGFADAPKRIEKKLSQAGFLIRWTDPSHVLASRPV